MKKLLTIAALAGVASLSYGQGYVEMVNSSGTRTSINTSTFGTSGGTVSLTPAQATAPYYYALFVAPSTDTTVTPPNGDPTLNGFTFTGNYGTNLSAVGRLTGVSSLDGTGLSIPGYASGSTANFAIVGWSGNLASTWAAAEPYFNGAFGAVGQYAGVSTSVAQDVVLAPAGGPYPDVMGSSPLVGGFAMYQVPIPEPTVCALCGLGAAALVIFRRRK